jgi:MSHA biogenesis protein MshQ
MTMNQYTVTRPPSLFRFQFVGTRSLSGSGSFKASRTEDLTICQETLKSATSTRAGILYLQNDEMRSDSVFKNVVTICRKIYFSLIDMLKILTFLTILLLYVNFEANAANYIIPSKNDLPTSCVRNGSIVNCTYLTLSHGDTITVNGNNRVLNVAGDVSFSSSVRINQGGIPGNLTINISGNFSVGSSLVSNAHYNVNGSASFGWNNTVFGDIVADSFETSSASTFTGDITADVVNTDSGNTIYGNINGGVITTDSSNTITGNLTGDAINTGSGNTIYGNINGGVITTDSSNTITGNLTGDAINTGSENTINGNINGGALSTAANNTITGNLTGDTILTGSANTIIGDIIADSITVNSTNSKITGAISALNDVDIQSGSTINGPVSGDNITTTSPVTINGDVTASGNFLLASGSTVNGDASAYNIMMLSSNGRIDGNAVAVNNIEINWNGTITGDATAPNITNNGGSILGTPYCDTSDGSTPVQCFVTQIQPVADYRFDELSWDGTAGEVEDSSGNNNHGRADQNANTISDGKVCRAGSFSGPLANWNGDRVIVDDLSNYLNKTASLSFWIKTTQTGNNTNYSAPGITGVEHSGGQDDIFWGWLDASGRIGISKGNDNNAKSSSPINDNDWQHIVLTWNSSSGAYNIYINGSINRTGTTNSGIVTNSYNSIGMIDNTGANSPLFFIGDLDEILIFDQILTSGQVHQIFDNQDNGKNWDGTDRICPDEDLSPLVEYRFDECLLNDAHPVEDFQDNVNATARNTIDTSDEAPLILNRFLDGNATPTGYIQPQDDIILPQKWSLSTWVKFPLNSADHVAIGGSYYYVFGSFKPDGSPSGGDLGYLSTPVGDVNTIYWGNWDGGGSGDYNFADNLNGWHHIVITNNVDVMSIYLDGDEVDTSPINYGLSGTVAYLLTSEDDLDGQTIGAGVDELKLYGKVLTQDEIDQIYDNESDGKNWDGTNRDPVLCDPKLCYQDNFSFSSVLGTNWKIIKNRNYTPNISDGVMQLTDASTEIATGITLNGSFPANDNLIELEFELDAYGGGGADGISLALADANVVQPMIANNATSIAGGYGGSLGYAQRSGIDGFAGGWLGFGFDEFGNYSNPTESRVEGPGARADAVAVRGSVGSTRRDGYAYIAGTDSLSLPIDQNTPHRYKVKIDTRSEYSRIWVYRDTDGSGFDVLDALNGVLDNQAGAPENFILSFTGSTGSVTNIHSIDDFVMRALDCGEVEDLPEPGDEIDHYRIEHDGVALTCEATEVTIKACEDSDCADDQLYGNPVTIELSPSGWVGGNTKTFTGEEDYLFQSTTAGEITLGISSATPDAETKCYYKDDSVSDCRILFKDTGIIIDGDADDDDSDNIVTQIAGKESDEGYNTKTIHARVVSKEEGTDACVPGIDAGTQNATFRYLIPVAGEGLVDNVIEINSNTSATLENVDEPKIVKLDFDDEAESIFSFNPKDAGRYNFRIDMTIPVYDGDGDPTGETIDIWGESNNFVVRPLAVYADAKTLDGILNPRSSSADDPFFEKAGEDFEIIFKSLRWTADRADTDGQWNDCQNSTLVDDPGSEYARVPEWNIGSTNATLIEPPEDEGGVLGAFDLPTDTAFAHGTNSTNADATYDEVGIIKLNEESLDDFLGEPVQVCSPNIGRFIPDHFIIEHEHFPSCSGLFTYAGLNPPGSDPFKEGQSFSVNGTITAENTSNSTTMNYFNNFAKLTHDDLDSEPMANFSSANGTIGVWNVSEFNFISGKTDFSSNATYRFDDMHGPEDVYLKISAKDSDNVNGTVEDEDEFVHYRYGRLRLVSAHGPETEDLEVPMHVQYFDGTSFVLNKDDQCTDLVNIQKPASTDYTGDLDSACVLTKTGKGNPGDIDQCDDDDKGRYFLQPPFDADRLSEFPGGNFNLWLKAPGMSKTGSVDLEASTPTWLQYDWNQNGTHSDDPTARATFGVRRTNDKIIFQREVF